MEHLIEAKGLTKRYDDFTLDAIDLTVPAGTVVGFVGSNGAGKTTTLKLLLGLVNADGGSISLFDELINGDVPVSVKQRIGVVLDTCAFTQESLVSDVATIGRVAYANWDAQLFSRLCERFDLPRKKKVNDLSRGMGMKLSLAFALAHHPQLLILDEATAGLDPLARDEVLDLLRDFMGYDDHGILMSSHITSDLERIADEVVCIDDGRIVFDVPKDAICNEAGVAHCRAAEVERIMESGFFAPGTMRALRQPYATDVLVPDRFAFARAFDDIAVDKASIEEYMAFMLKGEIR